MKYLKVETTAIFNQREPSKAFLKIMSKQVTERLAEKLLHGVLCKHFAEVFFLSISKYSLKSENNIISMPVDVATEGPYICEFRVLWSSKNGAIMYPWDEINDNDIVFDIDIEQRAIEAMEYFFPQLYHPTVKAKDSGLPFDYQIYNVNEGKLMFYPQSCFSEKDEEELYKIVYEFFDKWNSAQNEKICFLEKMKPTKKYLQMWFDFGGCGREAVEELIRAFAERKDVKKIVFKP